MDELVVVIMGVFIANYKVDEHPYLTSYVKAFLISLLFFMWVTGKALINNALTLYELKGNFLVATVLWLALSVFFILVEFVFKGRK